MPKVVIFSDLDGTLLDHNTYSFEAASEALNLASKKYIPVVLCTSKTRGEIEYYRNLIGNKDPFISENGGGIFIPKDYFSVNFKYDRELNGYKIIELGSPREKLIETLNAIADQEGVQIRGFSQMSSDEIMALTGLDDHMANLAKMRDFSEPFIVKDTNADLATIEEDIHLKGYNYTRGGRFHHILGENNKGRAVRILKDIYKSELGEVQTVGIGDSLNDLPMLEAVDIPIVVKKPSGEYDQKIKLPNLVFAEAAGPAGWNSSILKLFMKFDEELINNDGK